MDENISPSSTLDISIPGMSSITGTVKVFPYISMLDTLDISIPGVSSIDGTISLIPSSIELEAIPLEFDVNGPYVSVVGNTITLNISGVSLLPNVTYQLKFDSGVIVDELNNPLSDVDFPPFTFITQNS